MELLTTPVVVAAVAGALAGFVLQYVLQERKAGYEMRNAIAQPRVQAYLELWPMCDKEVPDVERAGRAEALWSWYSKGGGLFLSLAGSIHFFSALRLLKEEALEPERVEALQTHLTWMRTEMKFHVGSYSRGQARKQIPDAERPSRWMPRKLQRSRSRLRHW